MPVLTPHQPIETTEPVIKVENQLTPGVHHFSLVVEDERGRRSAQSVKSVTVIDSPAQSHAATSAHATPPSQGTPPSQEAAPSHGAPPSHGTPPSHGAPPAHGAPHHKR